jgi:DNA-binding transcriptional MerR regulator
MEHLSPVEAARRLGVTIKALKVYERHGLVAPMRLANGWRVYGPQQLARVLEVLALKGMGLSLNAIADLVDGRDADVTRTLDLHETLLRKRVETAQRALVLIAAARRRLKRGEALGIPDLLNLARSETMAEADWAVPLMRHYLRRLGPAKAARLKPAAAGEWTFLFAELKDLAATAANPAGDAAADFYRRWMAAAARAAGGDTSLYPVGYQAWQDAMNDPATAPNLPLNADEIAFLGRISAAATR